MPGKNDMFVQREDLGGLQIVATGGQGTVYKVSFLPSQSSLDGNVVYKEYRGDVLEQGRFALRHSMEPLISFPHKLDKTAQARLRRHTAWPLALVLDGDSAVGILMKEVPEHYYFQQKLSRNTSRSLLRLDHLLHSDTWKTRLNIPKMTEDDRYMVFWQVTRIVAELHDAGLVVGDFSGQNLIFTNPEYDDRYRFRPKLLDIDGLCFEDSVPPIPQYRTAAWETPEAKAADENVEALRRRGAPRGDIQQARAKQQLQSRNSDVFKMGLLALRLFHSSKEGQRSSINLYSSNSSSLRMRSVLSDRGSQIVASMLESTPENRPSLSEVLEAISRA